MKMILVFLVSFLTFSQTISSSWAKCQEATKRAYKWESLGSTGVIYPAELFPNQSMESNPTTGHIHSAYAPGREAEILVGTMPYRGSEEDIIEMLYKSDQGDLTVVSYKVKKKNWFVLSGTKDGQEVYIKGPFAICVG